MFVIAKETKIIEKIVEQRSTTYVTEEGSHIKRTPNSLSVYSSDPREPHDGSIHFNENDDGTFTVIEKSNGEKTQSSCYLTTACLKHHEEYFDDNCHELTVLRWFRDKFVKTSDISMYYKIAPLIVSEIDTLSIEQQDTVYNEIYNNVVVACVQFIEKGEYDLAYERYKNSILALQKRFLPLLVES